MPELRRDPVTQCVTIIAPERMNYPGAFVTPGSRPKTVPCPFCPGHEDQTPPAVLSYPASARDESNTGTSWHLRVVPNLYPVTTHEKISPSDGKGFFASEPSVGYHEVVIDSSRHILCFSELSPEHAGRVFRAYAERFREWQRVTYVRFGIAYKNKGAAAGASVEHAHSQLVSLPRLPARILAEWDGARTHFQQTSRCVYCDMIGRELQRDTESSRQTRVVMANERFVVFCPFASRVPYEMWVLPRHHASHFDRAQDEVIEDAGRMVHEMLTRLSHLIEGVPYNFLLHTAPFDTSDEPYYHWHIEIIPRLTREAGFEWGTGCHINPLFPEQAATRLRRV